ncbi:UDP-N-acetylglucosamine--dolichyl-phosphate N-acetylglucosaminephosphotransferase [Spinellus fusiger]|nr:UDP-N-acetylglucosamine--dolichyl-phosphate N-acetylglucosaminephosphotransferase [Spinellus fusiger]
MFVLWLVTGSLALLAARVAVLHETLVLSVGLSVLVGWTTFTTLPHLHQAFVQSHLCGKDRLKRHQPLIPESMGLPTAIIYLSAMFVFMPVPFMHWFNKSSTMDSVFPHDKLGEILSAVLAIQSMVLLGFADDVLDVRWRYKVWFPALAGTPLLLFYYTNCGVTHVVMPLQLRPWLGTIVDLGCLYYVYMALLIIFCTHSINILAGVNGIEAGQSLIIAVSVILNDSLYMSSTDRASVEAHLFSLYFMVPFVGATAALLYHNWFPARLFVGDTYCYFAGMTLAVVGILGHFTKTLVLFFLPQIFNFLYSCPQLFRLIECPRHRMPRLNDQGLLECSVVVVQGKKPMRAGGQWLLRGLCAVGLVKAFERDEQGRVLVCNNLTLINLVLAHAGPLSERTTAVAVLCLQGIGSALAFFIRYKLVDYVY